ncbi:PD-(D/E)XK nuclease family protein [Patescibacteria group bacterium]
MDNKLGLKRPPGYPFNLNTAVDTLLKKEFDIHRAKNEKHPLMETYGIDAVPFAHDDLDEWRENFKGVQYFHEPTDMLVTGAIDDVWQNPKKELIVVDYKATSKNEEVNLDADWQISYKRQMEVYQWLLRQNGFKVSDTGYFVYANGITDKAAFDGKLEFDVKIIPYKGSDDWIEEVLVEIKETLESDKVPEMADYCDFCRYRTAVSNIER